MGIFDNLINNRQEKTELEKLLDYFKSHAEIKNRDKFIEILTPIVNGDMVAKSMPDEVLCHVISFISSLKKDPECIVKSKCLYNIVVQDDKNNEQVELFYRFFDLYMKREKMFGNFEDFEIVYNLFANKNLVLSLYRYDEYKYIDNSVFKSIIDYAVKIRKYYVDEEAYYGAVMCLTQNLSKKPFSNGTKADIINEALLEDKSAAGIYEIDEDNIEKIAVKVNTMLKNIRDIEATSVEIKNFYKNLSSEINNLTSEAIDSKTANFTEKYKEALISIRECLAETQLSRKNELEEVKNLGNFYVNKIHDLLGISPEAKETIKSGLNNEEKATVVNPLLDDKIPFSERLKIARQKQKETGEYYHETFDKILKQVLMNKSVMLVGPVGTGKTYTILQLARLFNVPLYNLGFVADEYGSIKGYPDLNSNFVETPFYNCFKYGGFCSFDEVDNSESKALIEINKVIGPNGYIPYSFPNGELVKPHPNFRIIAAGNTWGDGASTQHASREQLDAATLDRFKRIYYGYDEGLEKEILKDYPDAYDFAIKYRENLTSRGIDRVISTRGLADIRDYLDSEEFSIQEILEIVFTGGIRMDTLTGIYSNLANSLDSSNEFLKTLKKCVDERAVKIK